MGYVMVKCNGEVNPCMLLQINLGNIREQSIVSIWEDSVVLAKLRAEGIAQRKHAEVVLTKLPALAAGAGPMRKLAT